MREILKAAGSVSGACVMLPAVPGADLTEGPNNWRLGVISNPLSGSNRHQLPAIRRLLANRRCSIPHRQVCYAAEVVSVLKEFARRNINLVAINAGDGTVQAVLTALFHNRPYDTLPVLTLLRGGTANMTAKGLGFRGPRIAILKRLLQGLQNNRSLGRIDVRPVLRVRHPLQPHPLYGMFFGAASIYRGIELFHRRVHGLGLRGNPAHTVIVARFLAALLTRDEKALGAASATIRVDGMTLPAHRYLFVVIHALDRLILRLRPHWGTEEGPLHLTAISAKARGFWHALPSLLWGRSCRHANPANGYFSRNSYRIRVTLDGGFAVDGEMFLADSRKGDVVIEAGGQASFLRL